MAYLGKTPSQATRKRYYKTASGSETSISGTMTVGGTLTFTDGEFVDVSVNGVALVAGTDYNTTTANTIGGLSALTANDQVEIVVYDTFSVFGGNVNADFNINNGNLTVTGDTEIKGSAGATLKLTSTDITGADTELLGQIDFVSSDASTGSSGTQARIKGVYEDNGDSSGIAFLAGNSTGSGTPTISEVMRIRHEGRVGITNTSPGTSLQVGDGSADTRSTFNPNSAFAIGVKNGSNHAGFIGSAGADTMQFSSSGGGARMTIDSSGNLLVGKTADNVATVGIEARATGPLITTRDGADALRLNRLSSEGEIIQLRKDGSTIGSITTYGDDLAIGTGDTGLRFIDGSNAIAPSNIGGNTDIDATIDLGYASQRFRHGFFSNFLYATYFAGVGDTDSYVEIPASSNVIKFVTGGAERGRFDNATNLLVGTTTNDIYDSSSEVGSQISDGYLAVARASTVAYLNRLTSDGAIVEFRKGGTTTGAISTISDDLTIQSSTSGHNGLRFGNGAITPTTNAGATADDAADLGGASIRFDDIFATNGTIQTSDQNEKQNIASLTNAEITAAKAIGKLFKTFKWKSKVTAKGDAARTHTGVIAQEVQAAMSAAGLDPTKYAFWCSDTWTNEDGNEQTRMGVRYPELMSFVLASIEDRITALENAQ